MVLHCPIFSMPVSILYWGAQNWLKDSRCGITRAEKRWRIATLDQLATSWPCNPGYFWPCPFNKDTLLVHARLEIHQEPEGLCCEAAFQPVGPQLKLVHGVILPQVRTSSITFLNFMRFLLNHFSSMLRFLWMAAWCSGASGAPLRFVLAANLLRLHSASLSRLSMDLLLTIHLIFNPSHCLLIPHILC